MRFCNTSIVSLSVSRARSFQRSCFESAFFNATISLPISVSLRIVGLFLFERAWCQVRSAQIEAAAVVEADANFCVSDASNDAMQLRTRDAFPRPVSAKVTHAALFVSLAPPVVRFHKLDVLFVD